MQILSTNKPWETAAGPLELVRMGALVLRAWAVPDLHFDPVKSHLV